MGFFKSATINEDSFFGEVENNLNNFDFNIKVAQIKLDMDLRHLGKLMMEAYRKLSSKWSIGGNKWHDMFYIARVFMNGEYYYDLDKVENIVNKLDRLYASIDDKEDYDWMIELVKQLDEYVVSLSRGMESWEEKDLGIKKDEHAVKDDVDLRELGMLMMNWHSSQFDPIYMTASYFVDGKDYPDLDVVERAKSEIEELLNKKLYAETMFDDMPLEKFEDDRNEYKGLTSEIKELEMITDGLTNYINSHGKDENKAQDQDKNDEDKLFEDS